MESTTTTAANRKNKGDNGTSIANDLKLMQRLLRLSRVVKATQDSNDDDDPHVLALLQRLVGVDRSPTVDADATRDGDGDENPNDDFNLDNGVDEEDDHPDDCISVDDADEDEQPTTSTPPTPAPPPPANGRKRKSEAMPSERPHAAVERHYRSVLKSKLDLLHAQVPASGTFSLTPSPDSGVANQQAVTKSEPKSVILDRAVRYVNHLVSTYEQYEREHTMLRQQLQAYIAN